MAKDRYHDWYKLYDKLSVEINPDPEELKQLFNQESPIDPINLSGLELKFEAATREHVVKFLDVWSEIYGLFWW